MERKSQLSYNPRVVGFAPNTTTTGSQLSAKSASSNNSILPILDQVDLFLSATPGRQSLLNLLRLATPDLKMEDMVNDEITRLRAIKVLKLKIHPDKHPKKESAMRLFQEAQVFIKMCEDKIKVGVVNEDSTMKPKKNDFGGKDGFTRTKDSPSQPQKSFRRDSCQPVNYPNSNSLSATDTRPANESDVRLTADALNFRVSQHWPELNTISYQDFEIVHPNDVTAHIACCCVNARGTIAHGKKIGLSYNGKKYADNLNYSTMEDYFKAIGNGGVRKIRGVQEMKEELVKNGPLVSSAFHLDPEFLRRLEEKSPYDFVSSLAGNVHPIMIEGWGQTSFGEVWIVAPFQTNEKRTFIPFHKFDIESECTVPKSNFEQVPWQRGPFFDHDLSKSDAWRQIEVGQFRVKTADLERLGLCFPPGEGLVTSALKKTPFELRNVKKIAHSRSCTLRDVSWDIDKKKWAIKVDFIN